MRSLTGVADVIRSGIGSANFRHKVLKASACKLKSTASYMMISYLAYLTLHPTAAPGQICWFRRRRGIILPPHPFSREAGDEGQKMPPRSIEVRATGVDIRRDAR